MCTTKHAKTYYAILKMVNQKSTITAEEKFFFRRVNYCIRLFERANMMFLFSTMKANVSRFVNRARW